MQKNGKLIAISGLDGSGKSTCIDLITEELKKEKIKCKYYHAMTPGKFQPELEIMAEKISKNKFECFSSDLIGLCYALDLLTTYQTIVNPELENGTTVILHRYDLCCLSFAEAMGAKTSLIKGLLKECRKPDLHIFLDIEPEKAYERVLIRANNNPELISDNETLEVLVKAKQIYKQYILSERNYVKVINAELAIDKVKEKVLNEIKQVI